MCNYTLYSYIERLYDDDVWVLFICAMFGGTYVTTFGLKVYTHMYVYSLKVYTYT